MTLLLVGTGGTLFSTTIPLMCAVILVGVL